MDGNKSFVAGIGSTNVDILYSGLPRLPEKGEEICSEEFSLQLGGGVPATMIGLGRLGLSAKIATELGKDMFSLFAKEQFEKNGVSPLNLYDGDKIPLNITSAMITPDDRTFVTYGKHPIPTDKTLQMAYEMCKGAKIVEMQKDEYLPVYKKLKEDGTILVFDTGFDETMSLETYKDFLTIADYYTPNRKEAMLITGTDTPEKAAMVLTDYFEKVTVKLDKGGCIGIENGNMFVVPSIEEYRLKDSTGAGDAFLCGFIYGIYKNRSLYDSILFGNITGGRCVTEVGCLSAYTDEKTLLEVFEKYR